MQEVLLRFLLVLFYVLLFAAWALNAVGLPGNWVLVAIALVVKLIPGWGDFSWWWFAAVAGLAVIGEVVESLLGLVVVAKKGGTRWGVLGSFAGGVFGVIAGSAVIPPVGSVFFGLVGAFAGAVAGEYFGARKTDDALKIGMWSFVGRALAIVCKTAAGFGIVLILITKTWL